MIAGYGSTGQYVLDLITRMEETKYCKIIVLSRTSQQGMLPRVNVTRVSAGLMDYYPQIEYVSADLNNIEEIAQILKTTKPDIIAYTGRFIKGIKYGAYSYPNELGYGVWLPLAAPLIYKLMKAVKMSAIDTKVINSSFPDGVCPLLKSVDLESFTGVGNLNHLVPRIKMAIAKELKLQYPYEVKLKMVGSHYLNTYVSKEGNPKGSPYHMEFAVEGVKSEAYKEITDEKLFAAAKVPMMSDQTRNLMISSDIAQVIKALCFEVVDESIDMHLPGALGYIGGYPCKVSNQGIEFDLPIGITLEKAEIINKDSLRCDGIDRIENGYITFTDIVINKMKKIFNIEYPKKLHLTDCEGFAYEIKAKLEEYHNE
jgi:hypothetical protein